MNELRSFFENNNSNLINKWVHYFEIYETFFHKYRNKEVVILEIGIYQGGSLKMWQNYFGKHAKIIAIDINPLCKQFEGENIQIFIGSQEDKEFLQRVKAQIPKVDILIDDGGHHMNQQITTFEQMYDHVKDDGIYLCEDLHTSYWEAYGGGYKKKNTFLEYTKNFIDFLNAWHSRTPELVISDFTRSTYAIHYYDSVIVIEKRSIKHPISKMTGKAVIDEAKFAYDTPTKLTWNKKLANRIKAGLNSVFSK
jgi:23S rRNA U2552 (ribose-2'-O)-methylase RlmE/FtsJ